MKIIKGLGITVALIAWNIIWLGGGAVILNKLFHEENKRNNDK